MVCTFFGHADAPKAIEVTLRKILVDLIETKNVKTFYVGNNGIFDKMVQTTLCRLSEQYDIESFIICAYLPRNTDEFKLPTLFPEGLELKPPKFAIYYRNLWMLDQSHYVITFVNRNIGGAYKFKTLAEKKGKTVINITI